MKCNIKGSSLPSFLSIIIPSLSYNNPQLHSTRSTMQFSVLAILSFLALTGSAQRCLKGNHANQGDGCESPGNLICSHNLKHVVSTSTAHCKQSHFPLTAYHYSFLAMAIRSGKGLTTVADFASAARVTVVRRDYILWFRG
jgi:hypothetical protein